MLNLAVIHEAIAEAIPERECLVHRGYHVMNELAF